MLADSLKVLLATSYVFSIKAQNFHWNVEGSDFPQLHEFFGDLYSEVYDNTIDRSAEFIRVLDTYTPGSMARFAELSIIQEQTKIPRAQLMIAELYEDNSKMLMLLNEIFPIANETNQSLYNVI